MTPPSQAAAVFLFAHQDDEAGVFQKIHDALSLGRRVYCLYFTTGVPKGASPGRRNAESVAVLTDIGVARERIYFVGEEVGIPDQNLVNALAQAANWLKLFLQGISPISEVYLPAWEGGHPDHDALHAIGVLVARELDLLSNSLQCPFYNGYQCVGPLFRTMTPIPDNGTIIKQKIPWKNRIRFLAYILKYPSQLKTWIGLFPMLLVHHLFKGTQVLQTVIENRISERPHSGALCYERRKYGSYLDVSTKISAFRESFELQDRFIQNHDRTN